MYGWFDLKPLFLDRQTFLAINQQPCGRSVDYEVLIVNLVFFPPRVLKWDFLSECAFSWSLPTCTFAALLLFKAKIDREPKFQLGHPSGIDN